MKINRLYSDDSGESHWDSIEVDFTWQDFTPPAKPLGVTPFIAAATVGFIQGEVGWVGEWHPVPQRQYIYILSGLIDVTASDGIKHRYGPGDGAIFEDTNGKGHLSEVIGDEPSTAIVITLAD